MASTFQNLNLHFADVPAFARWLATCPQPQGWTPRKTVYHNTYKPTQADWNGFATMVGMANYYEHTNGWDRGPHLFLATDTRADGIWVMTPPWLPGIHAGACNSVSWGIENVGDYQTRPMSEKQVALLVGASAALHAWQHLPAAIEAHRDCMTDRTCPGNAAYAQKPEIARRLEMALHTTALTPDPRPGPSPYTEFSPILSAPLGDQAGFVAALQRRCTGSPHYTAGSQAEIANAYWLICGAVGVDPWLAAAQMCHETGNLSSFWAARPQRNAAGIGCDNADDAHPGDGLPGAFNTQRNRYEHGVSFPTWAQHSVPAHVGRLLAYAVLPDRQTPMQAALVSYALKVRSLPTKYWGVAPKLKDLNGRWAYPGTDYATKLAAIANAIRGM